MKLWPTSVAIVVANRKRALRWYTKKLGMDVLVDDDHWVLVGKKRNGFALHLCQANEYSRRGRLEPGNTGIILRTEGDMMKTYRTLKRRGVRFPQPPIKESWGWRCTLSDPDGNEYWLAPSRE